MARNDMVLEACGPLDAGSSETPKLVGQRGAVAEALVHVGVPGQGPKAQFLVAIQRCLVPQPLVVRVGILVEVVVVRVQQRACRSEGSSVFPRFENEADRVGKVVGDLVIGVGPAGGVDKRAEERHLEYRHDAGIGVGSDG